MKRFSFKLFFLSLCIYDGFGQDTVQLKDYVGNLKKIEVIILGKSYSFIFDSGGGETMISPGIADRLNKKTHGQVTGFRMNGEMVVYPVCDSITISFGRTDIFHSTVGVWDVMSILPRGLPQLDGVISLKSFENKMITLDLGHNRLIIESRSSLKKVISKKKFLQSRFANGLAGNELNIFLALHKNNNSYWFLFDSGNIGSLLFSQRAAYEWELQADTIKRRELGTVSINIGGDKINTTAESAPIIYDGALNYDIIARFLFTIDFKQRKIWMD